MWPFNRKKKESKPTRVLDALQAKIKENKRPTGAYSSPSSGYRASESARDYTGDIMTGFVIGSMMSNNDDHCRHSHDSHHGHSHDFSGGGGSFDGGGSSGSWDSGSSSDSGSSYDSGSSSSSD